MKDAGIPTEHVSFHPKTGTTLRLEGSSVTNIANLEQFKFEFGYVTLLDTKVTDLRPLAGSYIWGLDLRETPITNLALLYTMKDLEKLTLSRRQIAENLDVLRDLRAAVGTNRTHSIQPGSIAWKNEFESVPH